MIAPRTTGLVLAATALLGIAASTSASAEGSDTGLRARLWVGAVGRYLLKDNEELDSPPFGTTTLAVEGTTVATGGGLEYKPIKWIGIEASIAYADAPVRFHSSVDAATTQHASFAIVPLYVGLNAHVINTRHLDLWFGPQVSYEIHPNDLAFVVPGAGTYQYESTNAFSYMGFSVGADIAIDENLALNLGFRWQDADGDEDGILTYDPTFVTVGFTGKI